MRLCILCLAAVRLLQWGLATVNQTPFAPGHNVCLHEVSRKIIIMLCLFVPILNNQIFTCNKVAKKVTRTASLLGRFVDTSRRKTIMTSTEVSTLSSTVCVSFLKLESEQALRHLKHASSHLTGTIFPPLENHASAELRIDRTLELRAADVLKCLNIKCQTPTVKICLLHTMGTTIMNYWVWISAFKISEILSCWPCPVRAV